MSNTIVLIILFFEGFVSISTEILTIRQLSPIVGSNVIVTSFIIGAFLLALAYGYRRGGNYQANFKEILRFNFLVSALLLGVGLSYYFVVWFFFYSEKYLRFIPFTHTYLVLYLTLLTVPLVYLLGQTIPISMNLLTTEQSQANLGGKILHYSTLGSFLGSVLTTIVLMHYFGVGWTVLFNCIILLTLSILLSCSPKIDKREIAYFTAVCLIILPCLYWLNVTKQNKYLTTTTPYNNYKILKATSGGKVLMINGVPNSHISDNNKGFFYIEYMKNIIFHQLKMRGKKILVLGSGGFSLTAEGTFDNHVTYVDIDDQIKDIAEKNIIPKVQGTFISDDARHFLRTNREKYSAIVNDVYNAKTFVPSHIITQEYFTLLKNSLAPNGIALLNMILRPSLDDEFSKRADNTIRSVFSNCMVFPQFYGNRTSNVIYVCNNNELAKNNEIYTDYINTAAIDVIKRKS